MNVTPHLSQNEKRQGGSAIDGRTTRHDGYQVSQRKRKRIEEVFGWVKTVGTLRKTLQLAAGALRICRSGTGSVFTSPPSATCPGWSRDVLTLGAPA
jgi:hypothetical protein